MREIINTFLEDIQPRYPGDTIRDHIVPGTFPRQVTEITYLEDHDRVKRYCPHCHRLFSIRLGLWERIQLTGPVYCWRCYRNNENHVLAYLAGQMSYFEKAPDAGKRPTDAYLELND